MRWILPVDTYLQFMKEYLDSTLRQTLLLMYALTLALDDIISVSRNSSRDYLNAYSAAFPTNFMY